jgi:hypothetical protein
MADVNSATVAELLMVLLVFLQGPVPGIRDLTSIPKLKMLLLLGWGELAVLGWGAPPIIDSGHFVNLFLGYNS